MNQDGSGESPIPVKDETHTISHSGGPQFMLMNLVNENGDESKHWQMVQIAKSYNEAVQTARITFHKILPEDVADKNDIVLKYRSTLPNESFIWAGLEAMVESDDLWSKMVNKMGSADPILGVFLEKKARLDLDGMPIAIYLRTDPSTIDRHPVPRTYQDLRRLVYTVLKKDFPAAPSHLPILHIYCNPKREYEKLDSGEYLNSLKKYRAQIKIGTRTEQDVVAIKIISS